MGGTFRVETISLFLSDTLCTGLSLLGGIKISEKTLVGSQVPKTHIPTRKNVKLAIFYPKISNIHEQLSTLIANMPEICIKWHANRSIVTL